MSLEFFKQRFLGLYLHVYRIESHLKRAKFVMDIAINLISKSVARANVKFINKCLHQLDKRWRAMVWFGFLVWFES